MLGGLKANDPKATPAEIGINFGSGSDRSGVAAGRGFEIGIEDGAGGARE